MHSLGDGEVTITANLVQFTGQRFQLLEAFGPTDTDGRIGSPEMAGDASLNFQQGPWNLRYGVTWIDDMSDYAAQQEDPETSFFVLDTGEYFLHDASVQYSAEAWRLTVGVRNMFDTEPPQISSADGNLINGIGATPFYSGFDYFGRQYFVNLSTTF